MSAATSRWVVSLFTVSILTQRLSLPGGTIPLLLPIILAWGGYALTTGIMEFDRRRTNMFLVAAALTGAVALAQQLFVPDPLVSLTSWGLFMTVWIPAVARLRARHRATVRMAFQGCVRAGNYLAAACIFMLGIQYVGVRYVDYLALLVPRTLLVQGYVITYPLQWDSPIYRANAWIGLEPSIISLQLGVCLVMAILVRAGFGTLLLLIAGMTATISGSGIFVVGIAVLVMLFTPMRRHIVRYPRATIAGLVVLMFTPAGSLITSRITEFTTSDSSASLRAIEPYLFIWPQWTSDAAVTLFGRGAGSSQDLISATNRAGLLVPSPVKVFFDYGLIAGGALAIYLIYSYYGAPSRSLAISLFASSWLLQPGTTTVILVLPTMLFVTWWAPWPGRRLEWEPFGRLRRGDGSDSYGEVAQSAGGPTSP